ncbi:MAG: hypothetical protein ABIQ04_03015 [Candidatus Saccharimonadales bacterium]
MKNKYEIVKKEIHQLDAIFIAAPRFMSVARFSQLVKRYLPKGNIILGISLERYVVGFENQPQFEMLRRSDIQTIVDKVAYSNSTHKIFILHYAQSELSDILEHSHVKRVLLINGSWKYAFHNSDAYKILKDQDINFKFISPFSDEQEARAYENEHTPIIALPDPGLQLTESEMVACADSVATQSFDNSFQTGVSLGRRKNDKYEFVTTAFNKVIPYQTYALHHGNSREKNLSQPHDLNHYDTIHAEMQLLTIALADQIDISETTLFLNLLPCPNCARTLSETSITEFVYRHDHSDGYAVYLLRESGKVVRRIVDNGHTL